MCFRGALPERGIQVMRATGSLPESSMESMSAVTAFCISENGFKGVLESGIRGMMAMSKFLI
eukprot:6462279-Amphidinium_carterae.2